MTLQFDEEAARRLEAIYTTPDVVEQRREVLAALGLRPGEAVIDVGSGPGLLAAEMAVEVGRDGWVCGIDVSESMLAMADARTVPASAARMQFQLGGADQIPLPDRSFDVAVSTQVLEYVRDVPGALREINRVLRPGGRVLVLDTDWDSIVWHNNDDERMRRVLAAWDEHLVHRCLPRTLRRSFVEAGFSVARPMIVALLNVGYERETYSAGMLELIAEFVRSRGRVPQAEVDAWAGDLRSLGPDYFFSLNRYLFLATKSE